MAFKLRTFSTFSVQRLVAALVLLAFVPAVISVGVVAAVFSVLLGFEAIRYAEARRAIRHAGHELTGDVWIDAIAKGEEPSRIRVSAVRFTPGARTAWHSHALGQTLYVTEGAGLVRSRGGDIIKIRSGDVISTPPDEWHWHGAAPDHFMTHISMTEGVAQDEGPETEWGAHVSDAEYPGEQQ